MSKLLCAEHQIPVGHLLEVQFFFVHVQGTKEGDSSCGLSITAIDIFAYAKNKYFSEYMLGRKK